MVNPKFPRKSHWASLLTTNCCDELNVDNLEKMINDDDTCPLLLFGEHEYDKRIFYEGTSDTRLRLQYRYQTAAKIIERMMRGEITISRPDDDATQPHTKKPRLTLTGGRGNGSCL